MDLADSSILVTGGLGFIGSHIAESLVRSGARVRILDNYRTGLDENVRDILDRVEIFRGDIRNIDDIRSCLVGIEAVSHHAAQLEITRAIDDPIQDLTTNTIGTLNLFTACAEVGVRKIVQATSAGVYGQAQSIPQLEDGHPTEPNWAYGVSKLANEKYAAIFHELHGLDITSLRYGIVYGPREWYGRVLTIFLRRAFDGDPLVVFGNGDQVRDFVYVQDVVSHHNACLSSDAANNEIFNVSTGVGTTVSDLARTVQEVTGAGVEIVYDDVPEGKVSKLVDRQRLPQELKALVQSTEKSERLLGWSPTTSLRAGLRIEWEWLKDNPDRWTKMAY